MPAQKAQFAVKGMSRDLADSKFNPEYAFENKNIRITPTEHSTLLVLSNEKGNTLIETNPEYEYDGTTYTFASRKILGYAVLNKEIVLFQKVVLSPELAGKSDAITKMWCENDIWNEEILYVGDLNFSEANPIETLPLYEAEDIKKVYWVDGINQPRVINIANDEDHQIREFDDNQFDFVPTLALNDEVTVERVTAPSGRFPAGTLQYAITYSRKNGQESKIAWISNLLYTTFQDRAGAPDELTPASYKITIDPNSVDTAFDNINIYSIIRTSEDAGLQTKLVARLEIAPNQDYVFVDSNNTGETIAPTDLLFKGGDILIANTLATKDNTLFLGNIKYEGNTVSQDIKDAAAESTIVTDYYEVEGWEDTDGFYPYKNPLLQDVVTYLRKGNQYRLGLQLQDDKGNWSEPIFVDDYNPDKRPVVDSSHTLKLPQVKITSTSTFISLCEEAGYKKVRPVVVFPEPQERGVIAQGIVCPTVFRKDLRIANNPFAQSSWFFRPYNPNGYDGSAASKYSVEARHAHCLAPANQYNAEVQNATFGGSTGYAESSTPDTNYYVDGSIITFHSPDIDDSMMEGDLINSELNIVGAFAIDSVSGRVQLVNTPPLQTDMGYGEIPESRSAVNKSIETVTWERNLFATQTLWKDPPVGSTPYYWFTYPWHKEGLHLDEKRASPPESWHEALLAAGNIITKVISNIRISQNFAYYDASSESTAPEMRDIRLFRKENGDSAYRLNPPDNFSLTFGNLYYKGTINDIVIPTEDYPIYISESINGAPFTRTDAFANLMQTQDAINVQYRSNDHIVIELNTNESGESVDLPVPYFNTDPDGTKTRSNYSGNLFWLGGSSALGRKYEFNSNAVLVNAAVANDPDIIPYYEGSSRVIQVSVAGDVVTLSLWYYVPATGLQREALPDGASYDAFDLGAANPVPSREAVGFEPVGYTLVTAADADGYTWTVTGSSAQRGETKNLPDKISTAAASGNEVMWITELTRDITNMSLFGGDSQYAIKNNRWLPCGEAVPVGSVVAVQEGDTIFNRWDCVKTLPYTTEDVNQVVEIMSFMCESYVNTAGRYDKHRGESDYTYLNSSTPFNQINPAYENEDNFFTYRITDLEKIKNADYPTLVTWSLTKTLGEEIDSWTHVVLSSSLNMDGDRGAVRALKRYKNSIFAFQDRGIAEVIYNPTMAVTTTAGVPIEIANSGKVEGKRYVSENIGCTNKWSICTTPAGIYFIDSVNKKVYLWSDNGMSCLSEQMGFTSWFNNQITEVRDDWSPENFNDFVTQYDRAVGDVYFINKNNCLAFNESLAQFTSFYDYNKTPFFINLDNDCIAIHNNQFWNQHSGEYNIFFNNDPSPYYTEVVVNPNPTDDKIFDNIEFRADSWNGDTLLDATFDKLSAFNEYQEGECELTWLRGYPSTLKRKFRVWYANIPRDKTIKRDRLRNTWLHLKLEKRNPGTERTVLHDLQVKYFI